jgi:hypothetical protein
LRGLTTHPKLQLFFFRLFHKIWSCQLQAQDPKEEKELCRSLSAQSFAMTPLNRSKGFEKKQDLLGRMETRGKHRLGKRKKKRHEAIRIDMLLLSFFSSFVFFPFFL